MHMGQREYRVCACVFVLKEDAHCAKQQGKVCTVYNGLQAYRREGETEAAGRVILHVHMGAEVGSDWGRVVCTMLIIYLIKQ